MTDDPRHTMTAPRVAANRDFHPSFYAEGSVQEDITPLLAREVRVIETACDEALLHAVALAVRNQRLALETEPFKAPVPHAGPADEMTISKYRASFNLRPSPLGVLHTLTA